MYTVTFYSYRGGVGRTTALVNVAVDLALRGRKVLLIDFDLEAPSLPSFALLRPEGEKHPGLVEFIDEYLRSGKAPDIADFVYAARDDVYPASLVSENDGKIWVMPAGRGDDNYWRAFHQIDWKKLYDLQDGFVLFEDIKLQLQQSFKPDYVLIDARAGINDRLAICTRQLPDAVVMLFTPDSAGADEGSSEEPSGKTGDQEGFRRVFRDVVEESLLSNPRRIDVFLVATKMPDLDEDDLRISNLNVLVLRDGSDEDWDDVAVLILDLAATIPHSPELLFERQVVANLRSRKRLPQAFRRLADALIGSNCCQDRESAQTFLEELRKHPDGAVAATDPVDRWFDLSGRLDQLIKNFDEDAEILAQAAACLFEVGREDEAIGKLDQAIELAPTGDRYLLHRTGPRSGATPVSVALADSILWQRASYRENLDPPGTVDDLLRILDRPAPSLLRPFDLWFDLGRGTLDVESTKSETTKLRTEEPLSGFPGIDPYVASAFQRLRELAPDKVPEALQKPRIQQLPLDLRQSLIAGPPVTPPSAPPEPYELIGARQWRAASTLLEARVAESSPTNYPDLFFLAMACWGAGDEARATELCRRAKELMLQGNQVESILQDYDSSDIEQFPLLSLMFWKAGDGAAARRFLDRCDELLPEALETDSLFSVWRFHHVKRTLFQTDCHRQRLMIQGHTIRPRFLGKEPGAT